MMSYLANIEQETLDNQNFRKVLYTGPHIQLVVMSLLPGEEIGEEIHDKEDQFIRVEQWSAHAILEGVTHELSDDMIVIIPAGMKHNIINVSQTESLKLYTIYSPKHHSEGTIHMTKAEADAAEAEEHLH